jgi:hypothetical protein
MNKEEIKILSRISDNLCSGENILKMTREIGKRYGMAYYSNIYNTIKRLEARDIIKIDIEGKDKLIKLNLENPLSIFYLSEIENNKLIDGNIPKEALNEILGISNDFCIASICILEFQKHIKINRLELLILIHQESSINGIIQQLLRIELLCNIKIDPIIVEIGEFIKIMKGNELHPLKDLILDKKIIYNSEGFWEIIRKNKISSDYDRFEKFPQDITRDELIYNYNRYGYHLYESTNASNRISLETIIFSMSENGETRIKYGALILLIKNIKQINWAYLYYLYKRYEKLGALKGILNAAGRFTDEKEKQKMRLFEKLIQNKDFRGYDSKIINKYLGLYGSR